MHSFIDLFEKFAFFSFVQKTLGKRKKVDHSLNETEHIWLGRDGNFLAIVSRLNVRSAL